MNGIGAVSSSRAIQIIRPVTASTDAGSRHGKATRQAYFAAGEQTRRQSARSHALFAAQTFNNDNHASTSPVQGAIAYLVARDRMTDLPIGFLITKSA
jgi:hypothetical protein